MGVALMSAYLFWRFWAAFPKLAWWRLTAAGLLAVLAGAGYWGRWLHDAGWTAAATVGRAILLVGLAPLFWFLCVGLTLQAWNLLLWPAAKAWPDAARLRLSPRAQFIAASVIVAVAVTWGVVEACRVGVRHVVVEVDRLPEGRSSVTIAQVSDLHVGNLASRQRLDAAIRHLTRLRPDIIVSTGDLVDGRLHETDHLAESLAAVDAPLGKYAVMGNHEFYSGVEISEAFHARAGFQLLRGQVVEPIAGLLLVGVDDPAARWRGDGEHVDEMPLLAEVDRQDVIVLLKHQPVVIPDATGRFDLQLSGHTHGGQIFPFGLLIRLKYAFSPGRHALADGSTLYLSPGTGTWGPPLRLGSPPEVTLIELRPRER
ncbi:MAG: metallophosphoesterase [Planctomycetota bacterium]